MKAVKTFGFLVFFFLLAPLVFSQIVQSGSWSVNQSLAGYSLDKNNGERTITIDIDFDNAFNKKPTIFLSVSQIDTDKETNVRYNVEAISISRDGFTLKVRTWADSKIFSLSGYWIAHSE
jgi:hypothetical protein